MYNPLYRNVKNTLVCSPRLIKHLHTKFEHDMKKTVKVSKGYSMSIFKLLGVTLETTIYSREDLAYYYDNSGTVWTLTVDYDKLTFGVHKGGL